VLARLLAVQPGLAMLGVLILCAAASGVMNDTPIVVLMLPVLVGAALRSKTSPARTLLPMNYAVLIGGMGTTIGTSTNLLVVAIAADLGVPRFHMFDFIHVTALAAVVGILYLWLVLPRLLPERASPLGDAAPQVFSAVLHVSEGGFADGKELSEVQKKAGSALRVTRILRGEGLELARLPSLTLRAGDRLHVRAGAKDLQEFAELLGAKLFESDDPAQPVDEEHPLKAEGQRLAEVVVTDASALHGSTLRATRFSEFHDVVIVGLHRAGVPGAIGRDDIGDVVLRAGDVLLVQGTRDAVKHLRDSGSVLVLDGTTDLPQTHHAKRALTIMALVVAAAALGILPIAVSAVVGLGLMLVTGCLTWRDAVGALSIPVIMIIVTSLALGKALLGTGMADYLAMGFVSMTAGLPPGMILSGFMLLMAVLTNVVSNNAAAAIGTPIAIGIAQQLGVPADPFILATLFGANMSFATPYGYQTNLLILSAGGYKFTDFLRVGIPLTVIMWVGFSLLLPALYSL
jgi:di/tricarboxylate transporter